MSNMVSGKDVIFQTPRQGFDARLLLDAVLDVWPDALFQNAEEEDIRPLTDVVAAPNIAVLSEFFVYEDKAAADSWDREGWTEEHSNGMAHFLVVEDPAHPESLQLTLVIGSITGETVRLIYAVYEALRRMSAGEVSPRKPSRRVNWEADLRAVGYTQGRDQFYNKVEELRKSIHPEWTADELACHPYEALQFCEVVRTALGCRVPDHLVMKALLNRRRQGKEIASAEPRLLWDG